jgi:hypothetical protein
MDALPASSSNAWFITLQWQSSMDKDRIGGVRAARACESMLICSRRPPHVKLATTDGYGGSNTGRKKKGDASIVMRFA